MAKKGVTKDAFKNDSSITSVKFGKDCGFVEEFAFTACSSLNEINVDNVIEKINKDAFKNTNLYSATFNELTTLDEGVFCNCSNLNNISIPKINSISKGAFENCENLKSVNINKTVEIKILENAFKGCTNLSDIYLNNCTSIGDKAFEGCENIKQISLDVCDIIGVRSFFNCNNLNRVNLYNSTKCVLRDQKAFCGDNRTPEKGNYNTYFYVKADLYDDYINDGVWQYYKDYIRMMVQENQIMYMSNQRKEEDLNDGIPINIKGHNYFNNLNYGLIEFNNKIENLYFKIFTEDSKKNITSIDLPSECKEIGDNVFEGYENLNKIEIPKTLTTIGGYAFADCSKIVDIDQKIKDISVRIIGDYAFKNCKSFTSFNIPSTVKSLGEGVFAGCENITKFTGEYASYNGRAVVFSNKLICVLPIDNSITEGRICDISKISNNIKILGKSCFHGCKNLRRVDIPSAILKINDNAFEGCENLREIHFSGEPPTLGENAFGDVSKYTDFKLFVPENLFVSYHKKWENSGYSKYIYPKAKDNSIIYYGGDNSGKLNNAISSKEEYQNYENGTYYCLSNVGKTVTNIFKLNQSVKQVILGENITEISNSAFEKCINLEYIYLSDSMTKLNNKCFSECTKLKRIHIPSGIKKFTEYVNSGLSGVILTPTTEFGNEIFYKCANLKEFGTYIKGLVTEDNRCYIHKDNRTLTLNFFAQGGFTETTYTIPDNINAIKESAFRCSNINSIKINSDLLTIGDYAFEGCKYLTSIENWDNVKIISNGTFKNCESLNKISLPSKLTSIGKNAFEKCIKMYIDTNIPDSVTSIGEYAFSECSNFRCVDNENKEVTLNLGQIECINKYTFYKCRHLSKVNINEKIKTIDSFAFCMSNNGGIISPILEGDEQPEVQLAVGINYLSIPINSKLKEINESAFEDCKNLNVSEIFLPNTLTTIGNNAFKNCTQDNTNITLKIPNNVEILGHSCFSGIGIEKLDMSETSKLTTIPYSAFENCKNLKLITFSSNASKIDIQSDAFSGCENLCKKDGKLILPNNITMINERAFAGCNYISRIELPTKLQVLGHECFKTSSKKSIYIKSNISQIPVFWKDGIGDLENMDIIIGDIESKSSPFCNLEGEISKDNINIYIPYDLLNKFKENIYWAKYNSCMIGSDDFKDSNSGGGGNDNPNTDNFDDTINPDAKI